ncbi:MAG: hypothetical protein JNM91_11885 [Flavobacteriales bacterium]|nr:hypothetical protein [Flavobacteriales bacterium]
MNDQHPFDEAARQKMAEREFVFQEEHWNDMERLIQRSRRKRRGFVFWFAAAAGLIGLPMLWWLTTAPGDHAPSTQALVPEKVQNNAAQNPTSHASEALVTVPSTANGSPTNAVAGVAPSTAPTPVPHGPTARSTTPDAGRGPSLAATRNNTPPAAEATGQVPPSAERTSPVHEVESTDDVHGSPSTDAETATAAAAGTTGPTQPPPIPVLTPAVVAETDQPGASNDAGPVGANEAGSTPYADTTSSAKNDVASPELPPTIPPVAQDSMIVPPPAPEMVRADHGRWQLSALGGTTFSNSTYAGDDSEEWKGGLSGRWSPTYGIEILRRGDRVGFGAGVQRTRYAERLRLDRLTTQEQAYDTYFTLTPVQVTLLVVIDTITIGAVDYYVTGQVDTVIDQLTRVTDTVQVTRVRREARDQVNVVDYWETSLFADLHTSKGRWSFGLRGGPTLGILSARRGVVPGPDAEGFTDLVDKPFRTMLLGYAARGYVRFRVWEDLSVGLEPMVRGHFGNAFASGDLVRRNNAYGLLFSLNYRLP